MLGHLQQGKSSDFWLQLNSSATFAILAEATQPATWKLGFVRDAYRLPKNTTLVRQLFFLRDKATRLLSYSSHTTFQL
jgi:hypothetical protein